MVSRIKLNFKELILEQAKVGSLFTNNRGNNDKTEQYTSLNEGTGHVCCIYFVFHFTSTQRIHNFELVLKSLQYLETKHLEK